jgi:two-component system, OmpR family, sensor histidine kinase KdpD
MRIVRPASRPSGELVVGLLVSAGAVALVSAAIAVLRPYIPLLSLGVLYVFAVLPVAVLWGFALASVVSVASMLAFNWFFLPPTHTFQLSDGANWLALAVYLATAVVVSALAARARRRTELAERRGREAEALAAMAGNLLGATGLADELERIGGLAAQALGLPYARVELGEGAPEDGEVALPLGVPGRRVASLVVGAEETLRPDAADRFLPAVASLLAVEIDRSALEADALETEALRRSDAIKTAVLHAVSHDLRSPLTAIVAAAGGLANPELKLAREDRAELVETIRAEANRLNRIVGNLLDLSRLRGGVAVPHPELWPVDDLVGRALDQLGEPGEHIDVELAPNLPAVRVDAGQIERVLVNLLDNALRFSPAPAGVRVRAEREGGELRVHVLDSGPGVAAADSESVFEPFRRGLGPSAHGAGLGLAIARGFAEVNGARVWSEDGVLGGHFVLALPLPERRVPV